MATVQPEIPQAGPQQLDWNKLARELNLNSAEEAAKRAYEIAAYIAEVEKDRNQRLMVKEGSKYFALSLNSLKKDI
jgi:hypothetical protein